MDPAALEQALAGLRDIHSPPPPGFWPLAPGWWLLMLLAVLLPLVVWFVVRQVKARRERLRVRKLALAELEQMKAQWQDDIKPEAAVSEIATLIRRAAIAKFGSTVVARLSGDAWLAFLQQQAPDLDWGEQAAWLLDQRFSAETPTRGDAEHCFVLSKQWLEVAL